MKRSFYVFLIEDTLIAMGDEVPIEDWVATAADRIADRLGVWIPELSSDESLDVGAEDVLPGSDGRAIG